MKGSGANHYPRDPKKKQITWGVEIHLIYFHHHSRGLTPLHSLINQLTKFLAVLCFTAVCVGGAFLFSTSNFLNKRPSSTDEST